MAKVDISVGELVDKVKRGELVLPEMQRRYVWPATRVRDLLDSLYRGYPSGMLLVWETNEDIVTRKLQVGTKASASGLKSLLLLDGQQRLTSLASILEGEPVMVRGLKRPIEVLFNLNHPEGPPVDVTEVTNDEYTIAEGEVEEEKTDRDIQAELKKRTFVVSSPILKNDPVWVSVSDIFVQTEAEILRKVGIDSNDPLWDKYSARLQKVRNIRQYQYVMQVLEKSMTYEEVTEIFVRVNSLGTKLRGSDLALAQVSAKWKGFTELVEDFCKGFGEDEAYVFNSGLPIRGLTVFATGHSRFKTIGRIKHKQLEAAWVESQRGVHFAVNFLQSNAGIDNLQLLSSPSLIIPIAYFAELKDEQITEKDTKKLLQWFYLAHLRAYYSGSSESTLDKDLAVLHKSKSAQELYKLLTTTVKQKISIEDVELKGTRSSLFNLLYIILRSKGAVDWFTNLALSDRHKGESHSIQYHHIFPKSILQKHGYSTVEINEVSNMAFIGAKTNQKITNKSPEIYFQDIIDKYGKGTLEKQLIPMDKKLWKIENYQNFLAWRRVEIVKLVNEFLQNVG